VHRREQLEREISALLPTTSPWSIQVGRLRCLRGIDTLSAVGLCAEIGDFERFARAEQLMSYVGLVPCKSTSGQQRRLGATPTAAPTSTPAATPTPTPTPTPAPAPTGVVLATGDVACDPSDPSYNGGAGSGTSCRQLVTSDLLSVNPPTRCWRSATCSTTPRRSRSSRPPTIPRGAA
jgi:hypothetical protein